MQISLSPTSPHKPQTWILMVRRDLLLTTTLKQSYAFPKEAINLDLHAQKTALYQASK